jgi:hypothetical protein
MAPSLLAISLVSLGCLVHHCWADGLKFLSLGDWGDDTTFIGSGLSKFFDEEAEDAPLGLLLGDNFYEAGVKCA